jgi:apolipoprotein N-acyltransferase
MVDDPPSTARPRQRWQAALGALLSGFLLNCAIEPIAWWWLGAFIFVPLLVSLDSASWRKSAMAGWLGGGTAIFVGFHWLISVVDLYSGLPSPAGIAVHLLFAGAHGLQWALFAGAAALVLRKYPRRAFAASWRIAALWVGIEVAFPNVFPTYLAMVWTPSPRAIAAASIVGAAGVSGILVFINALLACAWRNRRESRARLALGGALAIHLLVFLGGHLAVRALDARLALARKHAIGVVQGNFGMHSLTSARAATNLVADLAAKSAELEGAGAQLILWGETAYPFEIDALGQRRDSILRDLPANSPRKIRQGFSVPAIIGAIVVDPEVSRDFPFNSALVLQRDGSFGDRFDKNYPLWFGEYVPFVDPHWYTQVVPGAVQITRGQNPGALRVDDLRFGALICYEDLLPHFVRSTTQLGVHALVNLTNDSWFGASAEPYQHLSLAILRAVENRRSLVRAVNAGPSAHIDPAGRVVQQSRVTDSDRNGYEPPEGFVAEVALIDPSEQTWFTRTGHLQVVGWVSLALGLFFSLLPRNRPKTRNDNHPLAPT